MAYSYLFNPFVILVSSIWGTIDPVPVMFVTVGLYYLLRNPRNPDLAAFLLGLGIAFKLYPLILVPIAIATVPHLFTKIRFLILAITPFLATSLPALIYSPHQYFSVLTGFTTGIVSNGLGLYLSLWWLLQISGVRITATTLLLDELLYIFFIFVLSWAALKGKLSLIRATTIAILALFISAPRLNENYFLWALPITLIMCYVEVWSARGRVVVQVAWVPFALSALLFNGVPDRAVGLAYWGLVSFGQIRAFFQFILNSTRSLLVISFLIVITTAIAILLKDRVTSMAPPRTHRGDISLHRVAEFGVRHAFPVFISVLLVFLISTSAVNSYHYKVLPEDYGSYKLSSSQVVITDNFHALLLGPTWQFGGTGTMTLRGSGIVLDTLATNGTAWISRLVPNESFQLSLVASVARIYGPTGPLIIVRVPGGWLGVEQVLPPRNQTFASLLYYDEVTLQKHLLGMIQLGRLFNSSLQVSSTATTVSFNQTIVSASGRSLIQKVQLGQTDAIPNSGGQVTLKQLQLSWTVIADPFLFWFAPTTLVLTLAVLAVPLIWTARQRSLLATVVNT